MDTVLRALAVYAIVLLAVRLSGRRTMGELTAFDFVLLLIMAETTQQALIGEDNSITNMTILLATLIGADVAISLLKRRSRFLDKLIGGAPMIIVENGRPLHDRLRKARIDEADVMAAARRLQGLERMSEVKFAILEADGEISVIPQRAASRAGEHGAEP